MLREFYLLFLEYQLPFNYTSLRNSFGGFGTEFPKQLSQLQAKHSSEQQYVYKLVFYFGFLNKFNHVHKQPNKN